MRRRTPHLLCPRCLKRLESAIAVGIPLGTENSSGCTTLRRQRAVAGELVVPFETPLGQSIRDERILLRGGQTADEFAQMQDDAFRWPALTLEQVDRIVNGSPELIGASVVGLGGIAGSGSEG